MKVRGVTAEERQEARRKRTTEKRAQYYRRVLQGAAGSPRTQLSRACDYVKAIADDLPPGQVTAMVREVAELADRWSTK